MSNQSEELILYKLEEMTEAFQNQEDEYKKLRAALEKSNDVAQIFLQDDESKRKYAKLLKGLRKSISESVK